MSVSTAWRGGRMRGGRRAGSREPGVRSTRSEAVSAPARAEQAHAGLVPRGAGCATPGLPRRPLAPPHASARLPFKREAQLDLCRPRRGATPLYGGAGGNGSDSHDGRRAEQEAGLRAAGRRHRSGAEGSAVRAARGRRSGRARPGWGRGGGGRRGAGSPALGSASDCGAAGRCVITMARSLCPGTWLRKPYYLQVGRRRARCAPSLAARDSPVSLLLPWIGARSNPAAPCRPAPGGAPSPPPGRRSPHGGAAGAPRRCRGASCARAGQTVRPAHPARARRRIPRAPGRDPGATLPL